MAALLKDVGVDHCGGDIAVPEQLLNRADVGSALKQVGGEGMAKGMGADLLRQTGAVNRRFDRLVYDAGVHMMATGDAGTGVHGEIPGGKEILPPPFLGGIGIFPSQRMGKIYIAMPLSQILLMQRLDASQVVLEQRRQGGGKGGEPVFVPFA